MNSLNSLLLPISLALLRHIGMDLQMAFPSVTKVLFDYVIFSTFFIALVAVSVSSSFQFQVGGEGGWIKPTANETETYDQWATKNRFHVGDILYFRYQNDSVLAVNYTDYKNCIVSNPISKFSDGNTVLRIDRYGFFYFISGQPGHCKAGQKLIIRVMVQSEVETPRTAPSPKAKGDSGDGDGWDSFNWGPPSLNSTIKQSIASHFLTVLGGVLVILYLFM